MCFIGGLDGVRRNLRKKLLLGMLMLCNRHVKKHTFNVFFDRYDSRSFGLRDVDGSVVHRAKRKECVLILHMYVYILCNQATGTQKSRGEREM